jgi:cytochrome c-type biogenesis protein
MGDNVTYFLAFINGVISFFTPCILPLLPVYFGFLAGEAITNVDNDKIKRTLMMNATGFVLGITFLNVLLGFGVTAISEPLTAYSNVLRMAGGALMILFGIYFISGIQLMFFERTRKVNYKNYTPGFFKSFLLGVTFSFGWSPCNGPIIGSILIIASLEHDYLRAGTLMLMYSLGFAILFLLSAFLIGNFMSKVKSFSKYYRVIKIVSGSILVIMRILLIFNKLSFLNTI